MRQVSLSNGLSATIRVRHCVLKRTSGSAATFRRGTKVCLSIGNRRFVAKSLCHPSETFSRKTGRKLAAASLLRRCREEAGFLSELNREDRRAIFQVICPEYGS